MGQRVIWSCMSKDVTQWVKDCQTCSRAKVTRQPAAALQPIPVPRQWFSHIHMDIVVSREGFHYLFTIIGRSSRMLEAVPLANIETETCRDALINQWVARFGIPAHLTSDQGAQFTSTLWACLCNVTTTPPPHTTHRATAWLRPTGGSRTL
jgi:IS30 family transposase